MAIGVKRKKSNKIAVKARKAAKPKKGNKAPVRQKAAASLAKASKDSQKKVSKRKASVPAKSNVSASTIEQIAPSGELEFVSNAPPIML
jgi:hypothetical protein